MRLPVVAIVGRPNVGKSSLLNALARRRISIVQDQPGVTRDRVSTPLQVRGKWVELIDTGGYGIEDTADLTGHVEQQIRHAVGRAQLVLFVVDVQAGLSPLDERIADLLRKAGVPVALIGNKADGPKQELALAEMAALGFGTPLGVSATTGRNIESDLIKLIAEKVDLSAAPSHLPEPDLHMAVVGKRNAGKSSFVNAVARIFEEDEDRVIVSEVPGTTRDSVDVRFEKDGRATVIIDTAGVRKRRHMVTNDLEFYAYHRAERSIRRADVVLMMIDAVEKVSDPDKKLGRVVADAFKPTILVVNKWDLAKEGFREAAVLQREDVRRTDDRMLMLQYREYLRKELPALAHAPVAFTTAKDGTQVPAVLDLARRLFKQAGERVGTGKLNRVLEDAVQLHPPPSKSGRRARVYYATQVSTHPPAIALFVNDTKLFDPAYTRFLLNRLRESLPYGEVPVKLMLRGKPDREAQKEGSRDLTEPAARRRPRGGKTSAST